MTAAAAAAAARAGDDPVRRKAEDEEEDTNYTQFDLTIDTVNVSLSFAKWFNGKGLLRDVEVKGLRGVVDRTAVHYSGEYVDPRSYRHEHHPGDFEIEHFKMEDLLVTVHQPGGFRPFSVSIFSADLPQLRKQWLFYDILSANTMSGSFDDSLFTIHPRQTHSHTGAQLNNGALSQGQVNPWKKHSRLRVDGLNIDHLNRGAGGPFSWIHEGNVDIVADVMFPADNDESITKVMSDVYDRLEATITSNRYLEMHSTPAAADRSTHVGHHQGQTDEDKRVMVMDLRVHLNDVRAAVPLFTRDLSYVNNALIRPIVAYLNSRKTFIPIHCQLVKRINDFDGSWTIFDSNLMADLSAEVRCASMDDPLDSPTNQRMQTYAAIARDVVDDQARMRRFKKVGLWSLQLAVQALFMGMAGNIA
jgi:distribution and morphology protein 31